MFITVTELFLIIWALCATIAACYYHALVIIAKRFTARLIDDPELYAELRKAAQSI